VFTLQTLPAGDDPCSAVAGQAAGFSLHASVAARADERKKLERLCRYISRPAVSEARLSLTPGGLERYQLKTPYRDGTTHVLFEPLDFIARLAALVPKPRVNLTRYHGVFAPNSAHRAWVTKAGRVRGGRPPEGQNPGRAPGGDDLGATPEAMRGGNHARRTASGRLDDGVAQYLGMRRAGRRRGPALRSSSRRSSRARGNDARRGRALEPASFGRPPLRA
jgi:hypothetical protein